MSKICSCDAGLGNSGNPNCIPLISVIKKPILVPLFDSTGAENKIDLTATLDQTYWDARVNDTDSSKRWFPLGEIENVTSDKADSSIEEAPSGKKAFVKEGIRSIFGEIWDKATPQMAGQIKNARCTEWGVFFVDINGSLIGRSKDFTTTDLYPIPVDGQSLDVKYMFATDSTTPKVTIGFDISQEMCDEELYMITSDNYTGDVLGMKGLIDVFAKYSSISTAGFTVDLYTRYGDIAKLIPVKGLLLAQFAVNELSPTPGSIALTSVTESATVPGRYAVVYSSAQTSGDIMELVITKSGLDTTSVRTNTITTP